MVQVPRFQVGLNHPSLEWVHDMELTNQNPRICSEMV